MDFALLRDQGIKYLEKVASRVWTDYNTHDPGITILEQLCYAITDLSYRLDFDIVDLLTYPDAETGAVTKQFFWAHEILPINPVTVNDFRKVLIDVDGIRNGWLYKAGTATAAAPCACTVPDLEEDVLIKTLNGIYNVQLERDPDSEEEDETLIARVRARLNRSRNLCEDVSSITVLEKEIINIKSDIDLAIEEACETSDCEPDTDQKTGCDVNELLAQIYFALENHISPTIHHYSLLEMLENGVSVESMFTGPRLENGFVDDREIEKTEKKSYLYASDLIHIIQDIPNVKNIRTLSLKKSPSTEDDPDADKWKPRKWQLPLEPDRVPYLKDIDTFLEDCMARIQYVESIAIGKQSICDALCENEGYLDACYPIPPDAASESADNARRAQCHKDCIQKYRDRFSNGIVFMKGNLPYPIDPDKVKLFLEDLRNERDAVSESEQILLPPQGDDRELDDYESIQTHFPINYGIGNVGLPEIATDERRGQARQLRAYLMFFDQLLANYFSQLAHFKHLFSVNYQDTKTYFTQVLQEATGVLDLIDLKGDFTTIEAFLNSPGLLESNQTAQCRRDHLLNHLIARFSDRFTEYALTLYKYALEHPCDPLPVDQKDEAVREWYLRQKGEFLREYPELSGNRAKAFDYSDGDGIWDTLNVAIIKKRIGKLISLTDFSRHTIVPTRCFNEEFCEPFHFYEGFHLLEHILLRPGALPSGVQDWQWTAPIISQDGETADSPSSLPDYFSFQLSFVFPDHLGAYQGVMKRIFPPPCPAPICSPPEACFSPPEDYCCIDAIDPASPEEVNFARFKQFVEEVIHTETPAHITPLIHWLPPAQMAQFEYLYRLWLYAKTAAAATGAGERRATAIGQRILNLLGVTPTSQESDTDGDGSEFLKEDSLIELPMRLPVPVALPETAADWKNTYQRDCVPDPVPLPAAIYPMITDDEEWEGRFYNTVKPVPDGNDFFYVPDGSFIRARILAVGLPQLTYDQGAPVYTLHPERGFEMCDGTSWLELNDSTAFQFRSNTHVAFFLIFRAFGISDIDRVLISKNAYSTDPETPAPGFRVYLNPMGNLCVSLRNVSADDDDISACVTDSIFNDGAWHGILLTIFNEKTTTKNGCTETDEFTVTARLFTDVGDAPPVMAVWAEQNILWDDPPLRIGSDGQRDPTGALLPNGASAQIVYLAAWSFDSSFEAMKAHRPLMDGTALDRLWTANRVPGDRRHPEQAPRHKHTHTIALSTEEPAVYPSVSYNWMRDDMVAKFHGGCCSTETSYPIIGRHRSQFPYLAMGWNDVSPEVESDIVRDWQQYTDMTAVGGFAINGLKTENRIIRSEHIAPEAILDYPFPNTLCIPGIWYRSDTDDHPDLIVTPTLCCSDYRDYSPPPGYDYPSGWCLAPDGTSSATRLSVVGAEYDYPYYLWQKCVEGAAEIATASIWVRILTPNTRVVLSDVTYTFEEESPPSEDAVLETDAYGEPAGWHRLICTYPVFRCLDLPRCPAYLSKEDAIDGCFSNLTNMGLMLKVTHPDGESPPITSDIDVMVWGAQVEPADYAGPYIPAIQSATCCTYDIALQHVLTDYYVGNTGQVSFKVRFPFNAMPEDGETLCTLTGYTADRNVKMRISVFLETVSNPYSPECVSDVVLLVEHKLVSLPDSAPWNWMGECSISCLLEELYENEVIFDWDMRSRYYDGFNMDRVWLRLTVNDVAAELTVANTVDAEFICEFIAEYLNISGQARQETDFPKNVLPAALIYDVVVSPTADLGNEN